MENSNQLKLWLVVVAIALVFLAIAWWRSPGRTLAGKCDRKLQSLIRMLNGCFGRKLEHAEKQLRERGIAYRTAEILLPTNSAAIAFSSVLARRTDQHASVQVHIESDGNGKVALIRVTGAELLAGIGLSAMLKAPYKVTRTTWTVATPSQALTAGPNDVAASVFAQLQARYSSS